MRGLRTAALALAPVVAGTRAVDNSEASFSTAVIPVDLGDYDLGRELTLLFNVAEVETICGPAKVQINGQDIQIDDKSGRSTFQEDYGSKVTASWELDCVEVDGEPLKQTIVFEIEDIDGEVIDNVKFGIDFRQVAPVVILGFDGAASEGRVIDETEAAAPTYWELFGDDAVEENDDEVGVALAEIEYLRLQRHDIDDRIAELRAFIVEVGIQDGQCNSFWCWLKSVMHSMYRMASEPTHGSSASGPGRAKWRFPFPGHHHGGGHHHPPHHGNNTHGNHTHPPHKRPHWVPPFCRLPPHHPRKPHHPKPDPPAPEATMPSAPEATMPSAPMSTTPPTHQPHHPHQSYEPEPTSSHSQKPDDSNKHGTMVNRPSPKGERPIGVSTNTSPSKHNRLVQGLPHRGKLPFSIQMSLEICVVALVLLAITGAVHRCATRRARQRRQVLRNALREYCRRARSERRAARREARRRRMEKVRAWFRNLFYRLTGQLGDEEKRAAAAQNEESSSGSARRRRIDDEEQQQGQVAASPVPRRQQQQQQQQQQPEVESDSEDERVEEQQEQHRRTRAQSDASNTMEQDLAQFREVVGIVGNLVASEEARTGHETTLRTVSIHRDAGPAPPHMVPATLPQPVPIPSRPGFVNVPLYAPPSPSTRRYHPTDPAPQAESQQQQPRHADQDGVPPPAYESEDEDTLVSTSMVTDGFRYMSGQDYTPSQGGRSSSGADELDYSNKP